MDYLNMSVSARTSGFLNFPIGKYMEIQKCGVLRLQFI